MTFEDVYNYVISSDSFGLNPYINKEFYSVAVTSGIKYALEKGLLTTTEVHSAVYEFLSGNYGTAYDYDEETVKGSEYGQYKTDIEAEKDAAYIWIHRENHPAGINKDFLVCYFRFER